MNIFNNELYKEDVCRIANNSFPWEKLLGKKVLITGGSGLIGTFLVNVFMERNINFSNKIEIYVIGRNEKKILDLFSQYINNEYFNYIIHDINLPLIDNNFDYIIHAASNTHPVAYSSDPVGTITTNVFGTYNLLNNATNLEKFIFLSTVEIYGENNTDLSKMKENFSGYIDCNTLRAGYPESKRVSEALCQAFINEKNIDISIARLSRVYGPSNDNDSKAISQFIRNAINNQDIVLKSKGSQLYSFIYVADAVDGIFHVLFYGKKGDVYNVANDDNGVTLLSLAENIAKHQNLKVIFDIPNETEAKGFSVVNNAVLDVEKLKSLGWSQMTSFDNGISKTIRLLKNNVK